MKIFISWSGDLSKSIAVILREWLPGVIQAVKPYYSPDDITKGTRWNTEISKELDASKVGLICLTRENLESSWIMFEAGALSKNIEKSKVVPLLFGVEPSDIQGPLVQFQAGKFSKDELRKVVKMINSEVGENSLDSGVLDNVFDKWWPELEAKIESALETAKTSNKKDLRSDRDLLEEVLTLTRDLSIARVSSKRRMLSSNSVRKLFSDINELMEYSLTIGSAEIWPYIVRVADSLESIMDDLSLSDPSLLKEMSSKSRKIRWTMDQINHLYKDHSAFNKLKADNSKIDEE